MPKTRSPLQALVYGALVTTMVAVNAYLAYVMFILIVFGRPSL